MDWHKNLKPLLSTRRGVSTNRQNFDEIESTERIAGMNLTIQRPVEATRAFSSGHRSAEAVGISVSFE